MENTIVPGKIYGRQKVLSWWTLGNTKWEFSFLIYTTKKTTKKNNNNKLTLHLNFYDLFQLFLLSIPPTEFYMGQLFWDVHRKGRVRMGRVWEGMY